MKMVKFFARIYLRKTELEAYKKFYMALQGVDRPHHEFYYEAFRLDLVAIGNIMLIAGDKADTEQFEATKLTWVVEELDDVRTYLIQAGVKIINDVKVVPSGHNMRAMLPDGTIAEYVEHNDDGWKRLRLKTRIDHANPFDAMVIADPWRCFSITAQPSIPRTRR